MIVTKDYESKAKFEWIPIGELIPHPVVQRAHFDERWAKKIRDEFDPDKLGIITVCRITGRGRNEVIDGDHRTWAAGQALGPKQRIYCKVYEDVTDQFAAELFLALNSGKAVRALDKFDKAVIAGHPDETRIVEILRGQGLVVDEPRSRGVIRSPVALLRVFGRGEMILFRTIKIIKSAWGDDTDAYDGAIIRGIGLLVHRFADEIDDIDLARKLQRSTGPNMLLRRARDLKAAARRPIDRCMAECAAEIYNKGRRTTHLSFDAPRQKPKRQMQPPKVLPTRMFPGTEPRANGSGRHHR